MKKMIQLNKALFDPNTGVGKSIVVGDFIHANNRYSVSTAFGILEFPEHLVDFVLTLPENTDLTTFQDKELIYVLN